MDAAQLFLQDHARTHSGAVAKPEGLSLEDVLLGGLSDDQVRSRPNGMNSLVWLVWHMARCEDGAVNVIVAQRAQVIEEGDWIERLGLEREDIGTGMSDDEVANLSAGLEIAVLREYRAAVGRRTREVVHALRPETWDQKTGAEDIERAEAAGLIGSNAEWVKQFWEGKTMSWFLSWLAAGHNYMHLGEGWSVRSQAGAGSDSEL